jgi:hypothetical protein
MKRFKITKKYYSSDPNDYLYRVYERSFLFMWDCLSSHKSLERAEHHIASILESEERERLTRPIKSEEVVSYV